MRVEARLEPVHAEEEDRGVATGGAASACAAMHGCKAKAGHEAASARQQGGVHAAACAAYARPASRATAAAAAHVAAAPCCEQQRRGSLRASRRAGGDCLRKRAQLHRHVQAPAHSVLRVHDREPAGERASSRGVSVMKARAVGHARGAGCVGAHTKAPEAEAA